MRVLACLLIAGAAIAQSAAGTWTVTSGVGSMTGPNINQTIPPAAPESVRLAEDGQDLIMTGGDGRQIRLAWTGSAYEGEVTESGITMVLRLTRAGADRFDGVAEGGLRSVSITRPVTLTR